MAHEVRAERAPRPGDASVRRELDEISDLVLVEVVRRHEPELDGRRLHALLEVPRAEGEAIAEELEHVVLAGEVVGDTLGHPPQASLRV